METGYDVWPRLSQVRGSNDTVKLTMNKQNRRGTFNDPSESLLVQQQPGGNRDSFSLQVVGKLPNELQYDAHYIHDVGDAATS